jgi:glycosyltransferase involved in cell wall biosynthesis
MLMSELPRLLVISNEAPQTGAAGSIILFRLFANYPAENILVVTNRPEPAGCERLPCRYDFLPLRIDQLNNTRFWKWKAALRAAGAAGLLGTSKLELLSAAFKPDLVVTVMQDSWYYEFAAKVARRIGKPLIMFGHDLAHGFEPVPAMFRRRQLARDRKFLTQCAAKLCVSEGMVRFFEREFGVAASVLYPPRSAEPVHQSPEFCRTLKTPGRLTLGYAGGLHYGYGEQMLAMLPVLRETGTIVEMFGPLPGGNLAVLKEATDVFHFNGYLSPPEAAWRALLDRCDALLQPYLNPPGGHHLQYQTHFPSKLGDCLALGIPLLITGPADASGVKWCLDHPGTALCVVDPRPERLKDALKTLRDDADARMRIATGGQEHGEADFLPCNLQLELHRRLLSCAATCLNRRHLNH